MIGLVRKVAIGGLLAGMVTTGALGWAAGPALASTRSSHHGHAQHHHSGRSAKDKDAKSHDRDGRSHQGEDGQNGKAGDQVTSTEAHQSAHSHAVSAGTPTPARTPETTTTEPAAAAPAKPHRPAVKAKTPVAGVPALPALAATLAVAPITAPIGSGSALPAAAGSSPSTAATSLLVLAGGHPVTTAAGVIRARPRASAPGSAKDLYNVPMVLAAGPWRGLSMQAATKLSVPILFGAAVALFALLQALVDRRDPKLSRAPERGDDDTVGFG